MKCMKFIVFDDRIICYVYNKIKSIFRCIFRLHILFRIYDASAWAYMEGIIMVFDLYHIQCSKYMAACMLLHFRNINKKNCKLGIMHFIVNFLMICITFICFRCITAQVFLFLSSQIASLLTYSINVDLIVSHDLVFASEIVLLLSY